MGTKEGIPLENEGAQGGFGDLLGWENGRSRVVVVFGGRGGDSVPQRREIES